MSHHQQLQKPFECFNCKQQIKLRRKNDNTGWLRFNLDGTTVHNCQKNKKQQQEHQQQREEQQKSAYGNFPGSDLSKEVAAIKAHLQGLVSRLERIEQELR